MSLGELGTYVRSLREQRGWSQENLANEAHVDDAYIGRLENGKQTGSAASLISIAFALGIRPGLLLDKLAGVETPEDVFENRPGKWMRLPDELGVEEETVLTKLIKLLATKNKKE